MKIYKETVEKPRLIIKYDECPESPREWSTLGYFLTSDRNYYSPDGKRNPEIQNIMEETGNEANNLENHIELMKKRIEEEIGEKVLAIYPIVKYEHSGISYSLGYQKGFDYSNNGFYIITDKSQKETGIEKDNFEKSIENELKNYNKYANGEIYRFTLLDENGEIEDSCCGFYEIEDIRDNLPEEWKDEDLNQYLI